MAEVLNKVAVQCRFVRVATEQAQVSRLCLPDWPLRVAQRRLTWETCLRTARKYPFAAYRSDPVPCQLIERWSTA